MYTISDKDGFQSLLHNNKPCKCPYATRYIVPQGNQIAGMPPQFLENTGTCDSRCPGFELVETKKIPNPAVVEKKVVLHCGIRREITLGETA